MNPTPVSPRRNPEADPENLKLKTFCFRTVGQDSKTSGEAS